MFLHIDFLSSSWILISQLSSVRNVAPAPRVELLGCWRAHLQPDQTVPGGCVVSSTEYPTAAAAATATARVLSSRYGFVNI